MFQAYENRRVDLTANFLKFFFTAFVATIGLLIVYGLLVYFQIPAGRFLDWFIGISAAWWLLIIVTVPWDVYFQTCEILLEADESKKANIAIQIEHLEFVQRWKQISLNLALALHVVSATILYLSAVFGVSLVGYFAAVVAILLTALRPSLRAYQYLAERFAAIRETIRYPREDVVKLRYDFQNLSERLGYIENQLDMNVQSSWAARQIGETQLLRRQTEQLLTQLAEFQKRNQNQITEFQEQNETELKRVQCEFTESIELIRADNKFAVGLRDVLRFVKES